MKMYSKLLAVCVFHPNVWGTTAFFAEAPKALTFKSRATNPIFSYLGNLSGDTQVSEKAASTTSAALGTAASTPAGPLAGKAGPKAATPPKKATAPQGTDMLFAKNILETAAAITVQGSSLRTWTLADPYVERVQVCMKTEGRPLNADIDLWHGPDNTPQKMRVYSEDGNVRPFNAVIATTRGHNAIAIRNTGMLEFPLTAGVEADTEGGAAGGLEAISKKLSDMSTPRIVQGGAIRTYPFDPNVASVQVLLKTDGRPLNARIELLQGPNNIKQCVEIYCEDGNARPFFAVLESPGSGNVIRIVNTATMEYPLNACCEPYLVESGMKPISVSPEAPGGGMKQPFVLDGQW